MTGEQNLQPFNDKDYLEYLLYKLSKYRQAAAAYMRSKMDGDKLEMVKCQGELKEYLRLLKKRGFDGEKWKGRDVRFIQQELFNE